MTDEELLAAFEAVELPPGSFHHAEHVRVAFALLRRYDLIESLARYRRGLRAFATSAGVPGKYHETVTCALVILIHERMAAGPEGDESILRSATARRTFVLPKPAVR
jgi:hypothetical protein